MYKNLKIREFRQFQDNEILLGKRITVLAGRNSTGKSTILGLLANSGELKKKDGTTITGGQFRAEFSEILHGSKKYDASGSDRVKIEVHLNKVILYPKAFREFPNAPKHIVEAYESARKTMNIDNSISIVAIRKALELVCKDRGSRGKNLEAMLKEMVETNVLPKSLDECVLLIRKLGNSGAHEGGNDFYVSNSDMEELIDFIETIIYYIYELPAKIIKLNERYLQIS